ncbi:MAG: hypothetical protein AAFY58_00205 [Planctomycetota bacterium]
MTGRLDAGAMLAQLAAGTRLDGIGSGRASQQTDVSRAGFGELLDRAMGGELASGRQVELMHDAGVSLTPEQIGRVSEAADRAELAGMHRAMVQIDGMELLVDVPMRRVMGVAQADERGVISGVDGIVRVPDDETSGKADASGLLRGDVNASLLAALERTTG